VIIAAFISRYSRLAISRRREFLADAGAVELTKNPDALIRALLKLEANSRLERMPSAIQPMCFCNPLEGILALFSTHPSVADRIDALVQYGGGRMPRVALETSASAPKGPWAGGLKKQA
jgi:heat shock protein HtpX